MVRSGRCGGQPLRDGYGRAVLTPGLAARWYRCFPGWTAEADGRPAAADGEQPPAGGRSPGPAGIVSDAGADAAAQA